MHMAYQTVFKRYELKYILTEEQKEKIVEAMEPHMALDEYGKTTIRNIYFDTPSFRLVRRSIEKPAYKEKLRIRSYNQATPESPVFIELKKKYDSIVYKRRLSMREDKAMEWACQNGGCEEESQIANEINYFLSYYENLQPAVFLSYEREAYYCLSGEDFRVTFDDNILCRQENLSLQSEVWGVPVLEPGRVLMEIKCSGGIPLWMTRILSKEHIYKTSFSKYGTAYRTLIFPQNHKMNSHNMLEVTQNA